MILDSDLLDPPPVYSLAPTTCTSLEPGSSSSSSSRLGHTTSELSPAQLRNGKLPLELIVRTLSLLVARSLDEQVKAEGRVWMMAEGRSVCKSWYLACMSLLRSHYLPSYTSRIIPPYTSHPWPDAPSGSSFKVQEQKSPLPIYTPSSSSSIPSNSTARRETKVLDLYIASSSRRELDALESSLFSSDLSNTADDEAATRDDGSLFDLWQPRSRLEDLLIQEGIRRRVFSRRGQSLVARRAIDEKGRAVGTHCSRKDQREVIIVAEDISVYFALREVRLLLPFRAGGSEGRGLSHGPVPLVRRPILQIQRERSDPLEDTAQQMILELSRATLPIQRVELVRNTRQQTWYEEISEEQQANPNPRAGGQTSSQEGGGGGGGGGGGAGKARMRDRVEGWFKRM